MLLKPVQMRQKLLWTLKILEHDPSINHDCMAFNWLSYLENGSKHLRSNLPQRWNGRSSNLAGLLFNGLSYSHCI